MKKVAFKIICIILIFALALMLIYILNKAKQEEVKKVQEQIMQITEFNIDGRTILKTEEGIYVGNNIKELENNFYDVKIKNTKTGVDIYLNKLWYETYGPDYIQDEYLAKICRELTTNLGISAEQEQFEYVLYKYIKDNYMKARENTYVEEMVTENIRLKMQFEDDVVKLVIRGVE